MQIRANGQPIATVDDWFKFAPPKGKEHQWQDGFSAKELAKSWCGPAGACVPPEVEALLSSNASLGKVKLSEATPEHRMRIDDLRGGVRNADLAAIGYVGDRRVAISVEGKAAETFDNLVGRILDRSAAAIAREEWTNVPQRVQELARAILPNAAEGMPLLGDLRYQLLTATAGAVAFAAAVKAQIAVVVIHEFIRPNTDDQVATNAADLDRFVNRVSAGAVQQIVPGRLEGPFSIPGNRFLSRAIPVYVGKAQSHL